jgi:hypothetical protein
MKTDQRGVKYSCDTHSKQERNSYPRGCVLPPVGIDTSSPSFEGLPSHTHDFLGCCISPRVLVVEARLRLWRTRRLPLTSLGALEDDELPLNPSTSRNCVVVTSYSVSHHTDSAGNMISRVHMHFAHGCSVCAGLATPRESPSRELGTRFGGLMAYSYTRQRLSTSEEVLGRGLGKGERRKNTQPSMCAIIHPLEPRA